MLSTLVLCGSIDCPALRASADQLQEDLASHVHFLAQPRLQGRKTRTAAARLARYYIEERFKSFGLGPWGDQQNYELSFGLGINVVGVVPGSDTNIADEIVLLCAHYDHLGKNRQGKICPGAADNASGVAVLLEAARRFGSAEHRVKRTIAFAAFDAEEQMLLGSFAFCCRTDVAAAKIVAVLNVDMLGRDFFEVISNTVFVAGTEGFPSLQSQVRRFGESANIRVLPVGSDMIGPRSDHVAFENRNVPCLFFSCGTFKDYHQPGDTAPKLNYRNLAQSARVILRTTQALGNEQSPHRAAGTECDFEELKSVQTIVSELCQDTRKAGIKDKDFSALTTLNTCVNMLVDTRNYNSKIREELILQVARSLGHYFLPFGDQGPATAQQAGWSAVLPYLEHIYLNYHRELLEGQRQLVGQVLKHPPGLFHGVSPFHYEIYDIKAEDISVVGIGADRMALHALGKSFILAARCRPLIWPFGAFRLSFSGSFETLDCEGTQNQLIDYCLLYGHADQDNQLRTAAIGKILSAITGTESHGDYREWLQGRLNQGGFESETNWLVDCLSSNNPQLVHEALNAAQNAKDLRLRKAVREIILKRDFRTDVRAHALRVAMNHPDKVTLLTFTEVLDDDSPVYQRDDCPQFSPRYPLTESMTFKTLKPFLENTYSQRPDTIGQMALENLRKATKRNFGPQAETWRALIENWR